MAKTIIIDDIKIKSVSLTVSPEDGKAYVYVDYYLREEETETGWKLKNLVLKEADITKLQLKKVKDTITSVYKKVKAIEEI